MDVSPLPASGNESWAERFTIALQQQREGARAFLASQHERLQRAEAQLAEQLEGLVEELDGDGAATQQAKGEIDERSAQLARQLEALEDLRKQLDARQADWEQLQQRSARQHEGFVQQLRGQQEELDRRHAQLDDRQAALDTAEAALHKEQRALELARADQTAKAEQLAALGKRLETQQQELAVQSGHLADHRKRREAEQQEFAAKTEQLAALGKRLETQQQELAVQSEQIADHRKRLEAQQRELEVQGEQFAALRKRLEARQGELVGEAEQVAALRKRLDDRQAELAEQTEQLAARRAETESQRRHLARQLKAQHAEHWKDLERRRAERLRRDDGERDELNRQLATARQREAQQAADLQSLRARCDQLAQDVSQRSDHGGKLSEELRSLQTERDTLRQRLSEAESHLSEKQSHLAEAQSHLAEAEGRLGEAERRLLEAERRLVEAEHRLAEAPKASPDGQSEQEEYRRRYELALEDLREVKARNAELQQQLASARAAAPSSAPLGSGSLDWEAEKRRILAALESESAGDNGNEEARAERLKIEELVRKTDAVLAAKDREIAELKGLLANQSGSLGAMAVGAAAVGEVLDKDAIVQEERESLRRLQDEWREKLRQAEIELSLERAKLARQRADFEEKLRAAAPQESSPAGAGEPADKSGKPPRGRWLARLGLKDLEKE